MGLPRVSVIVPCYNAAAFIGETLESAFQQTGVELEVIVADDGSSDGSADLVAKNFPQAILERQANAGASAARNRGFALSTAPLIQFLDADDLLEPGKIAAQARAIAESGADVAYGDWDKMCLSDRVWQFEAAVSQTLTPGSEDVDLFTSRVWAPPAAYLLTRDIAQRAGPWSATLPVIQDARFMLDCALQGARFVRCPGRLARYRNHARDSLSKRSRAAFHRDCLTNAMEVYDWWKSHGRLDAVRKTAALDMACSAVNTPSEIDPALSASACDFIFRIAPDYVPGNPGPTQHLIRWFGFRRGLQIAQAKRRLQRRLREWGRPGKV